MKKSKEAVDPKVKYAYANLEDKIKGLWLKLKEKVMLGSKNFSQKKT